MNAEVQALRMTSADQFGGPPVDLRALLLGLALCWMVLLGLAGLALRLEWRSRRQAPATAGVDQPPEVRSSADPPAFPRELSPAELASVLLGRVTRLAALAASSEPGEQRLARTALLSTLRDCESLGLVDQARAALTAGAGDPSRPRRGSTARAAMPCSCRVLRCAVRPHAALP